jgi:hypothetical protein
VALLDLLFGCLGILLALLGIAEAMAGSRRAIVIEGAMGIAGITAEQQRLMLHLCATSLLGLAVGLVALLAGIALFRMWRWARAINLTYATLAAARALILFLFPVLTAPSLRTRIAGLVVGILYPIILLLLFQKPAWRAPFAKPVQPPLFPTN